MTENQIVREQQCSYRDTRVRDVECGPMIVAGVQDDEVDHVTKPDAVRQIAEDAGEQQRTGSQDAVVVTRRTHEVVKNPGSSQRSERYKKPATERPTFLQVAKRNAGVLRVNELKKTANHDALFAKTQRLNRPCF